MSPSTRDVKKHAKASKRRRLKAQERLARDRSRGRRQSAARRCGDACALSPQTRLLHVPFEPFDYSAVAIGSVQ
jgi:hypothetical protein